MIKKISRYVLLGFLGMLLLPNTVEAALVGATVNIDYNGGVSSDKFIIEKCKTLNDAGDCTSWETTDSKTNFSIHFMDWSHDTAHPRKTYIKISKVDSAADENFTVIYNSTITDVAMGKPINNFKGDDDNSSSDDVNELEFEMVNSDSISSYSISIYPTLRSFGWNFPDVNVADVPDAGIKNGTAELKTNLSDSDNILIKIKEGDYQILPGTDVTIQLLPKTGYQLTSLQLNGAELEAGANKGYYKFEMPNNNLHFKSIFESTSNIIRKSSSTVAEANVEGTDGLIDNGNLRLSIEDISDNTVKNRLNEGVTTGEVAAYVDLDLDNVLFKGTSEDVWSESLTDLGDDHVTISLDLGKVELTDDSYVIYEHDGALHTIPADEVTYNKEENTISFNTNQFSNYAIVTTGNIPPVEKTTHNLKSGENNEYLMTFEDLVEGDYELEVNQILDLLKLTDEELIELGIDLSHDDIVAVVNKIKNGVAGSGELKALYEISVVLLGNKKTEGPFIFKVKLTEELKKYNTFKIVYVDDEFNVTSTIITGTVKDGYILFTLPHLSAYALTASYVEPNPQTGDNILDSLMIGSVSLIGLIGLAIYANKKKFN